MKHLILIVSLLLFTANASDVNVTDVKTTSGFGSDLKLDATLDAQEHLRPDLYLPWRWNAAFETALEYRDKETFESERGSTSLVETTLGHKLFKLHLLKYSLSTSGALWQAGIGYGFDRYNKLQTGNYASGALTFSNQIDIDVHALTLHLDVSWPQITSRLSGQSSLIVTPYTQLRVAQDTLLSGSINDRATGSSEEALNPSAEFNFRLNYRLASWVYVGIEGRYQYLPLYYSLYVLNGSLAFVSKPFDVIEEISFGAAKLYWHTDLLHGFMPTIGYSYETTYGRVRNQNSTYYTSDEKWIVGLNRIF